MPLLPSPSGNLANTKWMMLSIRRILRKKSNFCPEIYNDLQIQLLWFN